MSDTPPKAPPRSPPHPEKAALRKAVLTRRAAMTPAARAAASARILAGLQALPAFVQAQGVHCFVSMGDEVETEPIFTACWAAGKRTFVPYQIREQGVLGVAPREPDDELISGPFHVREPAPHLRRPVPLEEIDLVLTPGVAFDRRGTRLGYGKAYYDLFLTSLRNNDVIERRKPRQPTGVAVVGLAFALQVVAEVPRESWDVPLDAILTEEGLIRTG